MFLFLEETAHLGYLQPIRTFSKCSNSWLMDSGVEHSVLALCVRVLITHCILKPNCGCYLTEDIGQCGFSVYLCG